MPVTGVVKGFKVFNPDWTCRGFKYEVGKEFTHEGYFAPCDSGLHFCKELNSCFEYYSFDPNNKVAEIEALGEVKDEDDKSCTNHIRIVREITWQEVLDSINLGKGNTGRGNAGDRNAGDRNAGHYNAGDYNAGDRNAGDRNAGHYNAGDYNAGHYNAGDRNAGHYNAGDRNAGDRNAGDFNSCNYSSGTFCSIEPPFLLFNKPSPISREAFQNSDANYICRRLRVVDEEGNKIDYKQAWANLWDALSNSEKITVQAIPNFDGAVFKEITGIQV